MGASALSLAFTIVAGALGQASGSIKAEEIEYQNESFEHWWNSELVWRFEDLPDKGSVPKFRVPYSGHDYPDKAGGTINVMKKYDMAFNGGRRLAADFEYRDVTAFRRGTPDWAEPTQPRRPRRGLFGRPLPEYPEFERPRRGGLLAALFSGQLGDQTPGWHGHCNGWTAASMRHAEPEHSVVRNGVTFSPADIKGLLADIYMYSDTEFLGGIDYAINPGTLHVVLANWIGRGEHPVGIETALGETVFNYPAYAYATASAERGDNEVEVKMNLGYVHSTGMEYDESPVDRRVLNFHYQLTLNDDGDIAGGRYYGDSSRLDMLWAPLNPTQGGQEGNERGNPYLDVKEVLALWRESVSEDVRDKWFNIDPAEEDRILPEDREVTEASEDNASEETVESDSESSEGTPAETVEESTEEAEEMPEATTTSEEEETLELVGPA